MRLYKLTDPRLCTNEVVHAYAYAAYAAAAYAAAAYAANAAAYALDLASLARQAVAMEGQS